MALYTSYLGFLNKLGHGTAYLPKGLSVKTLEFLYIMRNRGNDEVAPSKELLALAKGGKISWGEYAQNYLMDLKDSEEAFEWMFKVAKRTKNHDVVLICYEKDASHCHRTLLASEMARQFKGLIEYKGELSEASK